MVPLQVLVPSAIPAQQSPVLAELPIKAQNKPEEVSRRPPSGDDQGPLKATEDSGREQLGQAEEAIEVPPSA